MWHSASKTERTLPKRLGLARGRRCQRYRTGGLAEAPGRDCTRLDKAGRRCSGRRCRPPSVARKSRGTASLRSEGDVAHRVGSCRTKLQLPRRTVMVSRRHLLLAAHVTSDSPAPSRRACMPAGYRGRAAVVIHSLVRRVQQRWSLGTPVGRRKHVTAAPRPALPCCRETL